MKQLLFLLIPVFCFGELFYVDATNGSDAYPGTSADSAYQTISKVNGLTFTGSDSILFKRGETWAEQLTVPSSGTSGNPITFGAYGTGADPVIDGEDTRNYCVSLSDKDYVTITNLKFKGAVVSGVYADDSDNMILSNCTFDSNTFHIQAGDMTGTTNVNDISISNNSFLTTLAGAGGHWDSSAVQLKYTQDLLVYDNTFNCTNDQALKVEGGDDSYIYENIISNCTNGIAYVAHVSGRIARNHVYDGTGYGIAIQYASDSTQVDII